MYIFFMAHILNFIKRQIKQMQGVDFHGTETLELGVLPEPTELRAQRRRRARDPPPSRSPPEFWTRGPTFSFFTGSHRCCVWSCPKSVFFCHCNHM